MKVVLCAVFLCAALVAAFESDETVAPLEDNMFLIQQEPAVTGETKKALEAGKQLQVTANQAADAAAKKIAEEARKASVLKAQEDAESANESKLKVKTAAAKTDAKQAEEDSRDAASKKTKTDTALAKAKAVAAASGLVVSGVDSQTTAATQQVMADQAKEARSEKTILVAKKQFDVASRAVRTADAAKKRAKATWKRARAHYKVLTGKDQNNVSNAKALKQHTASVKAQANEASKNLEAAQAASDLATQKVAAADESKKNKETTKLELEKQENVAQEKVKKLKASIKSSGLTRKALKKQKAALNVARGLADKAEADLKNDAEKLQTATENSEERAKEQAGVSTKLEAMTKLKDAEAKLVEDLAKKKAAAKAAKKQAKAAKKKATAKAKAAQAAEEKAEKLKSDTESKLKAAQEVLHDEAASEQEIRKTLKDLQKQKKKLGRQVRTYSKVNIAHGATLIDAHSQLENLKEQLQDATDKLMKVIEQMKSKQEKFSVIKLKKETTGSQVAKDLAAAEQAVAALTQAKVTSENASKEEQIETARVVGAVREEEKRSKQVTEAFTNQQNIDKSTDKLTSENEVLGTKARDAKKKDEDRQKKMNESEDSMEEAKSAVDEAAADPPIDRPTATAGVKQAEKTAELKPAEVKPAEAKPAEVKGKAAQVKAAQGSRNPPSGRI